MTVLNVTEQGIHYLRACLDLYCENCAFPVLFFVALLFLCVKGSKEEKRLFLPGAIVLLLTVYNPLMPVLLMRFFDVNSEYYRFFWITPVVILVPYVAIRVILMQKSKPMMAAMTVLLIVLFILSGKHTPSSFAP